MFTRGGSKQKTNGRHTTLAWVGWEEPRQHQQGAEKTAFNLMICKILESFLEMLFSEGKTVR